MLLFAIMLSCPYDEASVWQSLADQVLALCQCNESLRIAAGHTLHLPCLVAYNAEHIVITCKQQATIWTTIVADAAKYISIMTQQALGPKVALSSNLMRASLNLYSLGVDAAD